MTETRCIHILVVDDDPLFRAAQRRNLLRLSPASASRVEVLEADGGRQALDVLTAREIDCMLLDYNMPGGSGMEWLARFLAARKSLAVVMLTGQGSEQLAVRAMKNGAMDYLVKGTITKDDLERAVLNALEKVELRQTIERQRARLLQAERQRVMIESLGTACHHLGQPATVINAYLQLMRERETDAETRAMIDTCLEAADSMADILRRLQGLGEYRSVSYLPGNADDASRILRIDPDS